MSEEYPVFQVGVQIVEERSGDVIVRVRAPNEEEARRIALEEVDRRIEKAHDVVDVVEGHRFEWDDVGGPLRVEGDSENDYPEGDYDADIDITDRPYRMGKNPKQLSLFPASTGKASQTLTGGDR